jgi:ribokinase
MVVKSDRLPKPGETIIGGTFFMNAGGKGANQAVAAARLGGRVTFIANVGNDLFGQQAISHFRNEGINIQFVTTDLQAASGVALINVDKHGENSITVAPGANGDLTYDKVEIGLNDATASSIILIQLEITLATVDKAIRQSISKGHRVILNPAPAQKIKKEMLKGLFLVTPNESEAQLLTGIKVTSRKTIEKAAEKLQAMGTENVIITLGAKGAYLHTTDIKEVVPAPKVKAVDSTGAGDCFNGAVAVGLSKGLSMIKAVTFAVRAASISVTRKGAQASMPFGSELI